MKNLYWLNIIFFYLISLSVYAKETCNFQYKPENSKLIWTAFKFTDKIGVSGTFKKIDVSNIKIDRNALVALSDIEFKIDTSSVDSSNPERDEKIKKYFFGSTKDGVIKGNFKNIKGKSDGSAQIILTWNGVTKSLPVQFKFTNETLLEVSGSLNVGDWKMDKAILNLNKVCFDLHKGKDGKSKLWSDVDIKIQVKLLKICK